MEHKIIEIFPTAVIKMKYNKELTNSEIKFITESENNIVSNVGNTFTQNTFILNSPQLENIKNFCIDGLNLYLNKIYNPRSNLKMRMTQSWINYTTLSGFHHIHSHPNSIISGVFYINADKEVDSINFQKNEQPIYKVYSKNTNDYNTNEVELKIGTGDLVLFPSTTLHYVPHTKSKIKRISIAFNSMFDGEIGSINGLDYLKL